VTTEDTGGTLTRQLAAAVVVGLVLVVAGTALASWVMTGGGDITIEDHSFETDSGRELSATVYEPAGTSPEDPAPVVTLIHGYTGERGTMASFARELADRGYVAVAVDQPGHAESDPPAFADDWGGPATLEFARGLETTDEDRVAMIGHSLGGYSSLAAAKAHPDGYDAVVLVGSTWGDERGNEDIPRANETFPRNLALLFAPYDEFSNSMYGVANPADVPETEKVRSVFGTDQSVEEGRIYGSVENGTARWYTAPPTIHTGMHRSRTAVGDAVEWVERTIGEGQQTSSGQSWYWATLGHVVTFLGVLLVTVGVAGLAWRPLRQDDEVGSELIPETSPDEHSRRALAAASLLPALTTIPLYAIGTLAVPTTRLTHQTLTHGYVLWILGTVAIAAGVLKRRHGGVRERVRALRDREPTRAAGAGFAGVLAAFLLVLLLWQVPGGGARAWLVGVGPLTPVRLFSALVYGPAFLVGGIGLALVLAWLTPSESTAKQPLWQGLGRNLALTCGGLVALIAVLYLPLFAGFGLIVPPLGPLSTQILRSTFLLAIATGLATGATNATGRVLVGGVLAGLFVTWIVVVTGPIHVAPF
jgi:pimeloyl-ACP methyl ester carboxylesterase